MQSETRESLQRRLKTLHKNLAALEEQKAKMGLDVTVRVLNEIEDTQQQIAEIEVCLTHGDFGADGQFLSMRPPRIYHNLPQPDYGTFVGREAELAKIRELLSPDSRHFLVTIDGIGGIGKSALALETAHSYLREYDTLPEEERFEAIIWTSAKSSVLTADGIKPRQQITRTLDDVYTTIAVTLEREDITRARPEEQDELMTKALTQQRILLIVDNLETIDDERVNAFLRELPAQTKAIVTTRHRIDVAYPVRLTGMPKDDGLSLIAQECRKKEATLTEPEKLYDRTGGVPLAIVWSVAQMGYGHSPEAVLRRLGQPTDDIARFCFEGAVEHVSGTDAHTLLMALSLFATDASREALGYVVGLDDDVLSRDEGLVTLERLSLVNKRGDRFEMLPLTKEYVLAETASSTEFALQVRLRQVDFYLEMLKREGEQIAQYELHESERLNILTVVDWCESSGHRSYVPRLMRAFGGFLWARGYWADYRQYIQLGLDISEEQVLPQFEAYFSSRLGRLYFMQAMHKQGEEYLQRAVALHDALGDHTSFAHSTSYLGLLHINQGRFKDARTVLERALNRAREFDDKTGIARVQNVLAQIDMEEGLYHKAGVRLEEARELREIDDVASAGLAATYEVWGRLRLKQGNAQSAVALFEKSLRLARQASSALSIAYAKKWLALAYCELGRYKEAFDVVTQASEIFHRLGVTKEITESKAILADVQERVETLEEAEFAD